MLIRTWTWFSNFSFLFLVVLPWCSPVSIRSVAVSQSFLVVLLWCSLVSVGFLSVSQSRSSCSGAPLAQSGLWQ